MYLYNVPRVAFSGGAWNAALRFALNNGYDVPETDLVVAIESDFNAAHKRPDSPSKSKQASEALNVARTISPGIRVFPAADFMKCVKGVCVPRGRTSVLTVREPEIVADGSAKVLLTLYSPPPSGSDYDGILTQAIVVLRLSGNTWIGDSFSLAPRTVALRLPMSLP